MIFAFVFIFHIGFSALPPVLLKNGKTGAGTLIYKYYSILCHQLPQRSFFLFGKQSDYPLTVPEGSQKLSFEEAAGFVPGFSSGRAFYGTPEMGYKMAICQRDVAIYGSMALYCLLFAVNGRRIPRPHWIFPLLIGVIPIALDGCSQLLGNSLPKVFPMRESTPLLRTVTGALFGFCLCWYLFPWLETAMDNE